MSSARNENRLESRLQDMQARGLKGVAPYVTAGDGGLETTLAVLRALDRGGASCVELGVPFSDPIADGPVLQAAAERSLAVGTSLEGVLAMVREFRRGGRGEPGSEMPIALFTYANLLARKGWKESCEMAAEAGVDAVLVPDLPVEEGALLAGPAREVGLCPIFFVAPTTSDERMQAAIEASRGFLYVIGRFGVTGAATQMDPQSLEFLARVRSRSSLPVAVGFGLRTAEQVAAVTEHADLAIVGSALVEHIHRMSGGREDFIQAAAEAATQYFAELIQGVPA